MFEGIFNLIISIVFGFANQVYRLFETVMYDVFGYDGFLNSQVNISLFSDNIIFSAPLIEIVVFISIIILTVVIIKFLIKSTYKIIKKVFGVIKL